MEVTPHTRDDVRPTPSRPVAAGQDNPQGYTRSRKPRREKKAACTECRQQKLKCDLHLDPNKPCSRCTKFTLSCFQALGFQRVEVRKARKSKGNYNNISNTQEETQQICSNNDSLNSPPINCLVNQDNPDLINRDSAPRPVFLPIVASSNFEQLDLTISPTTSTISRTLSDIQVSGKIINECFNIFFSHYCPLFPVFSEPLTPNACYSKSLTLFWTIIIIGSRSLISDPTLLQGLAPEVLTLALTSFQLRRNPLEDIKGLLLLCVWPCPSTTLLKDNTVTLTGLLLSLSMQAGLHVPTSAFAHLSGAGTEKQSHRTVELASLWAYVVIVCQSTMAFGGYPSMVSFTNMARASFEKTSWQFLPNCLRFRYKMHALLSEFESVIVELDLDGGPTLEKCSLSTRIKAAEAHLDEYYVECCSTTHTPYDEIDLQISRLLLEVLQLYCKANLSSQAEFNQLFTTASKLIVAVKNMDDATNIASYTPSYLASSVSLAAFTLLRMSKSHFQQFLPPETKEEGKSAVFTAVHLLKQISLMNNDIYAKSADFLSTMWTHQSFFKTTDPSSWCKLRVRNRLSMSVVFDSMLVWMETYTCVNVVPSRSLMLPDGPVANGGVGDTPNENIDRSNGDFSSIPPNERWLYELDWNVSLDSLMAEHNWGTVLQSDLSAS